MIVTLDTNVLVQALHNRRGPSGYILRLIRLGKLIPAISGAVYLEYEDVLKRSFLREKLGITLVDVEEALGIFGEIGLHVDITYRWRPNLRDEADNMLVELAVRSQSQFIITSNVRDFTVQNELRFDEIRIATPGEFAGFWRTRNESS